MRPRAEIAVEHGLRFVGKPYIWGGQGPIGLDCSGLIIEILRATGVINRTYDNTAQGLFNEFRHMAVTVPRVGDLVFFGEDSAHITHVALIVEIFEDGTELVLEAAGGRRGIETPEEAQAMEAMVTVRPMRHDGRWFMRVF